MKQVVSFLLMLFNTSIPWSVVWPQLWGPNAMFFLVLLEKCKILYKAWKCLFSFLRCCKNCQVLANTTDSLLWLYMCNLFLLGRFFFSTVNMYPQMLKKEITLCKQSCHYCLFEVFPHWKSHCIFYFQNVSNYYYQHAICSCICE